MSPLKGRKPKDSEATKTFLETSSIIEGGLFFFFTALVIAIAFLGQEAKGPQLVLNLPAPERIVAEFPFTYESALEKAAKQEEVRAQVPPVFERTYKPYEAFRETISKLNEDIAKTQIDHERLGEEALRSELERTAREFTAESDIRIDPNTIVQLTTTTSPRDRSELLENALGILKTLYDDGVYSTTNATGEDAQITVIQLMDEEGRFNLPNARSREDALITLRVRINALSSNRETARTLFDIFRKGVTPNLVYSPSGTDRAIARAIAKIPPVTLSYKEGETIVEPGMLVTPRVIERLNAYQTEEKARGEDSLFFNLLFIKRVILTLLLLFAVFVFIRDNLRKAQKRNQAIAMTAVAILLNLLIIRMIMELGEVAMQNSGGASAKMLPYLAPVALGPILVAVLVGGPAAVLTAIIVSAIYGIVLNNSMEYFLIALISGVVGSIVANNIRKRSRLVRAGLLSGITAAIAGSLISLVNGLTISIAGEQTLMALIVGLITGILAVGFLPVFEHLFKVTTEITLLELTDFNHPLLRRMQIEAPGTYHHSLMVANLSENAAAAIGASPLLCRVCCFFHDIGKLVKPEYFVENQRGGINPHMEKNPSMSALVIKAHVKEGVELARKNKLPRVIIDVIRQHHGTSLIKYFYYQAQKQQEQNKDSEKKAGEKRENTKDQIKVDESTYRYDGPKPAFKESAIIFFADGVEAASRTLKKVTQPAVEELIDDMFRSRIEDGQLDECPLTFKELDLIRSSFVYTVLNTLHSRIEYPKEKKEVESEEAEAPKNEPTQNEEDTAGSKQPV